VPHGKIFLRRDVSESCLGPPSVPLPSALPLFASGLSGLGLLGWRRKIRGDEMRALRELKRNQEPASPFVFVTERGGPFTTDAVNRLVKRLGESKKLFGFPIHIPCGQKNRKCRKNGDLCIADLGLARSGPLRFCKK
jgi:hypothetical protein